MRERDTKALAARIDSDYLKRPPPLRRWKRILSFSCLGLGLAWLGAYALARNQGPYTPGDLSTPHSFLVRDCSTCHSGSMGVDRHVTDKACESCHNAPAHNAQQASTPLCGDCHREHLGVLRLNGRYDQACVNCHHDLQKTSGAITINGHIDNFSNHPQFAAIRAGLDPVGFKFSHAKHVGELSQKCGDCHTPAARPQGMEQGGPRSRVSSRALMTIPTYAATCMPCHALNFDDRVSDAAPHAKPVEVDLFVRDSLTKYIAAHSGDLGKSGEPATASAWIGARAGADEAQLWSTVCQRCHAMGQPDSSGLPVVAAAKATSFWFTKATFDHSAHQELTCDSCHPNAATSKASSDLLLPGLSVCTRCHNSGKAWAGNTCATCHRYHDWSKEKSVDGKFKIEDLSGSGAVHQHK